MVALFDDFFSVVVCFPVLDRAPGRINPFCTFRQVVSRNLKCHVTFVYFRSKAWFPYNRYDRCDRCDRSKKINSAIAAIVWKP